MSDALAPWLPSGHPGTAITVGTFDGVHQGHWKVLEALRARADVEGLPAVLVTFHPHPLRVIRPEDAPALLTTPDEKKEILAESGLDFVVFLRFGHTLRSFSPEQFVRDVLIRRFRMRQLVIGYDHGFGRGRSGDAALLQDIGRRLGFQVVVIPAHHTGEEPISSSRIRRLLLAGHVREAASVLGRPYSLRGPVIRGDGRGRALGFPTANLQVTDPDKLLPREGVYAVTATRRQGTYPGVLHLGHRPMFPGSPPTIELHLLDFDEDLYGEQIRIEFRDWLREIERFATVDALVAAIHDDCRKAQDLVEGERDE
jgi:riboflavin kinase / FMN adenylyltransferase